MSKEAMQMALDALNGKWNMDKTNRDRKAIQALRAALAQPDPEPELLEALRQIADPRLATQEPINIARAAIAKATGKS